MTAHTNFFSDIGLERNAELREDAAWSALQHAHAHWRALVLGAEEPSGRRVLVDPASGALRWLDRDARATFLPDAMPTYLGSDADGPLFALAADASAQERLTVGLAADLLDLRAAGLRLSRLESGLFAYARALLHWQARTRWCGACGAPVELVALGHRGRCTNAACALEHFPRVDPAMIVIVSWEDRCLLGRQASWGEHRWSTLAGFVEPGESLEDAVRREVREEAGVIVGECEYHSSQPWPFPSSLMLGFTAHAIDPTIQVGCELAEARWFDAREMLDRIADGTLVLPPRLSVSHELIAHWLHARTGVVLADVIGDRPFLAPRS